MTNEQLLKKWENYKSEYDRTLFQEYVIFCNFSTNEQFKNFLNLDAIIANDFFDLVDFFYTQNCFLFLSRLLRKGKKFLIEEDRDVIEHIKISDKLEERFKKFVM